MIQLLRQLKYWTFADLKSYERKSKHYSAFDRKNIYKGAENEIYRKYVN